MTDKQKKILIAAVSVLVLGCLALCYPALADALPLQYGVGGQVNRTIPKEYFAGVTVALLLLYDGWTLWPRRRHPVGNRGLLVFCVLSLVALGLCLAGLWGDAVP